LGIGLTTLAIFGFALLQIANGLSLVNQRAIVYLLWTPILLAMAGLLLHEHAYVQAGQSVPLA
jgi:hypothetical protein